MDTKQVKGIAKSEVKAHEKRMHGAKGYHKGGKTDSDMLKMGRGLAKVRNQQTGMK